MGLFDNDNLIPQASKVLYKNKTENELYCIGKTEFSPNFSSAYS